jgi:D-beta-D-heptose 7-phosphate kinase/D-beta-D-heptose 1-phosphate adenosyltransferase
VVRNVVAMGARCHVCAGVGDDAAGERVVELLEKLGVRADGVVRMSGRPTTRKTRVEARSQQMLRFDRESEAPAGAAEARALLRAVDAVLGGAEPAVDGVVLEDYGKGLLSARLLRAAMKRFAARGLPVAVDPKELVAPYRGARLFKPNLREVESLTGIRVRREEDLSRAVARLRRGLGGADVVVTRGAEGMTIFEGDAPPRAVPVARSEVFDIQGAGDTCIAALALGRLAGGSLLEAAVLATAAAGVVVGKLGTATASPEEIRALLPAAAAAAREAAPRRRMR